MNEQLADKIKAIIDEFLESRFWLDSYKAFQENKGKLRFTKTFPIVGEKTIEIDNKLFNPQMIDRVILEMKDGAYRYCQKNPERVKLQLNWLVAKLQEVLAE